MNKKIDFRLRDALVVAEVSNDRWSYYAFVRGVRIPLAPAQYIAARVQAGLPKQVSFK